MKLGATMAGLGTLALASAVVMKNKTASQYLLNQGRF